ncbi:MAG: hypothetical protein Q9198_001606 [Flavoplaca austrocitrina]
MAMDGNDKFQHRLRFAELLGACRELRNFSPRPRRKPNAREIIHASADQARNAPGAPKGRDQETLVEKPGGKLILLTLLSALAAVNAAPATSSTCVTAIGIPSLDPACLPAKAEGVNLAPSPKFLFSAGNYCATFSGKFASITVIPDAIPAGKQCTVFTFTGPNCSGTSKESSKSAGCIQVSALPTAQSAKFVCG